MVLDPINALTVACAVVQFVDFSWKLISKTYEFHGSADGTVVEYREQMTIASNLETLSEGLDRSLGLFDSSHTWSANEAGLQKVTADCRDVARQLQGAIKKLKVTDGGKASFWRSFHLALTTLWKKQDMEELQRKLNDAKEQVMIHLMVVIRQVDFSPTRAYGY